MKTGGTTADGLNLGGGSKWQFIPDEPMEMVLLFHIFLRSSLVESTRLLMVHFRAQEMKQAIISFVFPTGLFHGWIPWENNSHNMFLTLDILDEFPLSTVYRC